LAGERDIDGISARWHGEGVRSVSVSVSAISRDDPERIASDKPSGGEVYVASLVHLDDKLAAVVAIQPVADAGLEHRSEVRWFQAPARPPLRRLVRVRLVAAGTTGEPETQTDRIRCEGGGDTE